MHFKKKMSRKFTETEKWYLLSNADHIMSDKKFEIQKSDDLYKGKKQIILNAAEAKKILWKKVI